MHGGKNIFKAFAQLLPPPSNKNKCREFNKEHTNISGKISAFID